MSTQLTLIVWYFYLPYKMAVYQSQEPDLYIYSKVLTLYWLTPQQSWTLRTQLRRDRLTEMGGGGGIRGVKFRYFRSCPSPPSPLFGRLIGGFTAEFKYALYEATRNNNKQKTMKNWQVSFLFRDSTLYVESTASMSHICIAGQKIVKA
jgi:hypothetical protein